MAKKIATVESLDTKATNCGFDSGAVKNKFFYKYGNTFPNKRCPTKSTITQTLSGMVKSISYAGSRPNNALVPIDDVNFYQYDVNNVDICIYNDGDKEIYKNAMTIDFYMSNKNVGRKEIPSSNINAGTNKNESITLKIEEDLLSNSGYFDVRIKGGYYGQFASCYIEYSDEEGDHPSYGRLNGNSIVTDFEYYPVTYVGIHASTKKGGDTEETINIYITYTNDTNDYTDSAEINVSFYDNGNALKKSIYLPKTYEGDTSSITTSFKIESDKKNGHIIISTGESHILSGSFNNGTLVSDESSIRLNNTYLSNNSTLVINAS